MALSYKNELRFWKELPAEIVRRDASRKFSVNPPLRPIDATHRQNFVDNLIDNLRLGEVELL